MNTVEIVRTVVGEEAFIYPYAKIIFVGAIIDT